MGAGEDRVRGVALIANPLSHRIRLNYRIKWDIWEWAQNPNPISDKHLTSVPNGDKGEGGQKSENVLDVICV